MPTGSFYFDQKWHVSTNPGTKVKRVCHSLFNFGFIFTESYSLVSKGLGRKPGHVFLLNLAKSLNTGVIGQRETLVWKLTISTMCFWIKALAVCPAEQHLLPQTETGLLPTRVQRHTQCAHSVRVGRESPQRLLSGAGPRTPPRRLPFLEDEYTFLKMKTNFVITGCDDLVSLYNMFTV